MDLDINFIKSGGLEKNGKSKVVYEKDIVLEQEKTYIFIVFVLENGSIKAEGMNTNFLLNDESQYQDNNAYKKVVSAYENEIPFERTRYKASNSR